MEMRKLTVIGLAAAIMSFAACQSDYYKVEGTCDPAWEGDTIFLSVGTPDSPPIDTSVVTEGAFTFEGVTDKTDFGFAHKAGSFSAMQPLFIEPGTVKLHLSDKPIESTVGGTANNARWRSLANDTRKIGLRIDMLASQLYSTRMEHTERQCLMDSINKLNMMFGEIVANHAYKNARNGFGRFLVSYFSDFIPDWRKAEITDKMRD